MTEKNKRELEELSRILINIDYCGKKASEQTGNKPYYMCPPVPSLPTPMEIAKAIQQAGYTKSKFPLDELKAWLEEMTKKSERFSKDKNGDNIELYCGANSAYIQVLDKIAELEGSDE